MRAAPVFLPGWLAAKTTDCGPGAYGDLAPELRSRLKSQIAFLHHCLGESTAWSEQRQPWMDRVLTQHDQPLDWVLFGFSDEYFSGPGLLAALLPAVLAGCAGQGREVVICRISESTASGLPLELSAALELLGQEQLFQLTAPEFAALSGELSAQSGQGRVVALGDTVPPPLYPCTFLPGRVKILVDPDCGADLALLRWAQPGAEIIEAGPDVAIAENAWLALLTDKPQDYGIIPDLWLAPGNEAFWLWPELHPYLFRACRAGIGRV